MLKNAFCDLKLGVSRALHASTEKRELLHNLFDAALIILLPTKQTNTDLAILNSPNVPEVTLIAVTLKAAE